MLRGFRFLALYIVEIYSTEAQNTVGLRNISD